MFQSVIQVRDLTPEQFADLVEQRSYAGTKRALAEHEPPAPPSPTLPEYLTRRQTKEVLQRSFTTLNTWAKATDDRPAVLVPLTLNGQVRYRRDDVLSLLKERHRFSTKNA